MTLLEIAGFAGLALLLIWGSHLPLSVGNWRLRYPRLALALGHGAFFGGFGLLTASLVCAIVSTTSGTIVSGPRGSQFWLEPTLTVAFCWLGLAAIGGFFSLIAAKLHPVTALDRQMQLEAVILAAACRRSEFGGVELITVDSPMPLALSFPGQPGRVVIASCLQSELTALQLRAVLEHELAHLSQHHGRISQLAQLKRTCLPMLPGSAQLERSTQLLLELIADDTAARRAGAVNTANALAKIGALRRDESMELRAHRIANRPPRGSLRSARRFHAA